ncbi:alpha/beta hydrolase [Lentisphaera profundi]|uniref:Alpha/beta hydrolase n=1 Tax=Lentisphaera profundi TaxID=1658616 RepID=A0ABY7VSV2_9BACT|nr:alpha/beta hydrolase [Lentisphaera profundi]WDE96295.1 alpha/beta hydrolase [Lentisphaera profundi]
MKNLLVILTSLLSITSFAEHQLNELAVSEYSNAENIMLEKVKEDKKIYQVWPGDGKRINDPAKDLKELGEVKGILRIKNVARPTLTWVKPAKPDGRAILICPGGAYNILAATHEGSDVAGWLAKQGITPFILKYRVPRRKGLAKHAVALEDSQRAMSLIRHHAKTFGVNQNQIGILGFSAGGHLSALTLFNPRTYRAIDEIDTAKCTPNFGVLIYAAYTMDNKSKALDPLLLKTHKTPIYSAIGKRDKSFLPGLQKYMDLLLEKNYPVEHHVYDGIGHGVGLVGTPFQESCEAWLQKLKLP